MLTTGLQHACNYGGTLALLRWDKRFAPDAVFSGGTHKSGLWAEVGPGRMKARGLDEKGMEEYYRNRDLLKAKVTTEPVVNAVLFLVKRLTPTTGICIPEDGGLPDATPR